MITVAGLSRRFGSFAAVDDISFTIPSGQIVGLLGHNGAGKTTIMKMLTGFLEPSAGQITIDGQSIDRVDKVSYQRNIGYLPESLPVYPELTILDYLDYAATLRGIDVSLRPMAIGRVMQQTELADKAAQPIGTLSRGYRQRVGVAQALLAQPKVLILDEPTNGLDPVQIGHMRRLIKRISQQSTVILSTHILQEVKAVCDRVLIIRHGCLVVDDTLAQLSQGAQLRIKTNANLKQLSDLAISSDYVDSLTTIEEGGGGINCFSLILSSQTSGEDVGDYHQIAAEVAHVIVTAGYRLYALERVDCDLDSLFQAVNDSVLTDSNHLDGNLSDESGDVILRNRRSHE